jgi:tetratricopeptide (TPR) repeat protein
LLAALATLERMSSVQPDDPELSSRMADTHSWLGRVAEQQGDFAEAKDRYAQQTALLEGLVRREPRTARWRFDLADVYLIGSDVDIATGVLAGASEKVSEARRLLDELGVLDGTNHQWLLAGLIARLKTATIAWKQEDLAQAAVLVGEVKPQFERLAADEPSSRVFALGLVKVWLLENRLRTTIPAAPPDAAEQAVGIAESIVHDRHATRADVGDVAQTCIVAGEIATMAGNAASARSHWQRADDLLRPLVSDSLDWRLLDPAARVAAALGRTEEARRFIERLQKTGYVPLDPWPPELVPIASKPLH